MGLTPSALQSPGTTRGGGAANFWGTSCHGSSSHCGWELGDWGCFHLALLRHPCLVQVWGVRDEVTSLGRVPGWAARVGLTTLPSLWPHGRAHRVWGHKDPSWGALWAVGEAPAVHYGCDGKPTGVRGHPQPGSWAGDVQPVPWEDMRAPGLSRCTTWSGPQLGPMGSGPRLPPASARGPSPATRPWMDGITRQY